MNQISEAKRVQILTLLTEGNSIRGTARIVGCAINTVIRYLKLAGKACQDFHDDQVRGVRVKQMQVDEIWSFVYAKDHNAKGKPGAGDRWTWVAIDKDTKLVIDWYVGDRGRNACHHFMNGVATRVYKYPAISSDAYQHYHNAIRQSFGYKATYGQVLKVYQSNVPSKTGKMDGRLRYVRSDKIPVSGNPDPKTICTAHIERQNLSMRMHMRRFARKTNAFSKSVTNHKHAIALHFFYMNFVRKHSSLKTTPAVAAGLAEKPITLLELVKMIAKS